MILLTVLAVSIDAYAAGLTYGSGGRADGWSPLYISAFSFVLPAAAMLAVSALTVASDWLNAASACIIIILGVRGVASPPQEKRMRMRMKRGGGWAGATLLGLSLSADTAVGAAALAAEPFAPAVPFLTFAAHYLLFTLGSRTAKLFGASRIAAQAASAAMTLLGCIRLLG